MTRSDLHFRENPVSVPFEGVKNLVTKPAPRSHEVTKVTQKKKKQQQHIAQE